MKEFYVCFHSLLCLILTDRPYHRNHCDTSAALLFNQDLR